MTLTLRSLPLAFGLAAALALPAAAQSVTIRTIDPDSLPDRPAATLPERPEFTPVDPGSVKAGPNTGSGGFRSLVRR